LETGGFFVSDFFNESQIETIYLDFPQSDYKQQLTNNYSSKTEIEAKLTYRGDVYEQVGVRYRGFTSYMSAGDKKSFNIELDWLIDGQDIDGYNSFKLNNAFDDPSNMREVLYNNLSRLNIASAKSSFVNLVVNGESYGVYANIQKLNKDHVKEWYFDKNNTRWRAEAPSGGGFGGGFGGFGAGTSSLNDLGESGSAYENAYTLKFSDLLDPWQDLADAAHVMGTTSSNQLVESLIDYMDVDAALWFIATENLFADDDGYINKGGMDYYVYFDLESNRIIPIEYDGNSVLAANHVTSWSPFYNETNSSFPLMNILLSVPELRQRYLAHYRTLMEESLNPTMVNAKIDAYAALINNYVANASVRQYSDNEFSNGVASLKQVVSQRYNYVLGNSEVSRTGPVINNVQDSVNGVVSVRPLSDQSVNVSATVSSNSGISAVNLYYGEGLTGRFVKAAMAANGGTYTATIPAMSRGQFVRYYIEAVANDGNATASYSPRGAEHDVYVYQVVSADTVAGDVVINEVMASNTSTAADEEGEFGDWIELYNKGGQAVDLSGYYLTDEESTLDRWAFPQGTVIQANSTLIVWADNKESLTTGLHANFKLSASGENVYLVTPSLQFADQLTFTQAESDESYARSPNATGEFSWTSSPTFNAVNN